MIGTSANSNQEQFTIRGHLDQLEQTLNDMITELSYHQQQVDITRGEKETAGACLEINIVKTQNQLCNEEHR